MNFTNTPDKERQFVAFIAKAVGATVAVETGSAEGGTAHALAEAGLRVVSIDRLADAGAEARKVDFVNALVEFVEGDALEELPRVLAEQSPGFVLLDDYHAPAHVAQEIELVLATPSVRACVIHDALADSGDSKGLGAMLRARPEKWALVDLGPRPGVAVWFREPNGARRR